jgi:hypothetical protein
MRNRAGSRKNTVFHRGYLESAGLGEVSYFLKKARLNIDYAIFSLEHTDFSEAGKILSDAETAVGDINRMIIGLRAKLDDAEVSIVNASENLEETDESED